VHVVEGKLPHVSVLVRHMRDERAKFNHRSAERGGELTGRRADFRAIDVTVDGFHKPAYE